VSDQAKWRSLADAIGREVTARFPEWTEANDGDPGVTLLTLFGWLTERMLYSHSTIDASRVAARQLAAAASRWVDSTCEVDTLSALLRPNYFEGQVLDAEDLRSEQAYFRQRLRRLNLRLHGHGVVSGLGVSVRGGATDAQVQIAPGVAIDGMGEEIVLADCVTLPLPARAHELHLQVRWIERPCRPMTTADASAPMQYSRIADTGEAVLVSIAAPDAVTIAHLTRGTRGWTIRKPRASGKSRRRRQ
jgi:hypothetical protein